MGAVVLGATGLCGSAFLRHAERHAAEFGKVFTITRRELPTEDAAAAVTQIVEKDSTQWAELLPAKDVGYLFTALATTRAAAGGLDKQYKIDHDLNVELARAAKEKGCSTLVVVSSMGANEASRLAYFKMKGEIERDLLAVGFERTVILRPGALLGERKERHKGFGNGVAAWLGGLAYRSKLQGLLGYPVYGDEVGKVGVHLALHGTEKVQIVESAEILRIAESLE